MKPYQALLLIAGILCLMIGAFISLYEPVQELPVSPPESSFDVMTSGQGRYFDVMIIKDKVYKCEYVVARYVSGITIVPRLQGNGQPYCGKWVQPR